MSQRESSLLWLKDVLESLRENRQRVEEAESPEAARILLEGMLRDLECCKRLCEALRARLPAAAA